MIKSFLPLVPGLYDAFVALPPLVEKRNRHSVMDQHADSPEYERYRKPKEFVSLDVVGQTVPNAQENVSYDECGQMDQENAVGTGLFHRLPGLSVVR